MIEMGRYEIDTWYFSPYPDSFAHQTRLLICPFSLKYFRFIRFLENKSRSAKGPSVLRRGCSRRGGREGEVVLSNASFLRYDRRETLSLAAAGAAAKPDMR